RIARTRSAAIRRSLERGGDRVDGDGVSDAASAGATSRSREDTTTTDARWLSARQLRQRAHDRQPRETHSQKIRSRRSGVRSHRHRLRHGLSLSAGERSEVVPRVSRITSRIALRLMLFNILLVFLPVAGTLLLVTYEQTRERAEIESMQRQAHLIVSVGQAFLPVRPDTNVWPTILRQWRPSDGRLRVVDTKGRITADSGPLPMDDEYAGAHKNW